MPPPYPPRPSGSDCRWWSADAFSLPGKPSSPFRSLLGRPFLCEAFLDPTGQDSAHLLPAPRAALSRLGLGVSAVRVGRLSSREALLLLLYWVRVGGPGPCSTWDMLSGDEMTLSMPQAAPSWVSSKSLPGDVVLESTKGPETEWASGHLLLTLELGAWAKAPTCGWVRRAGSHGRGWHLWRG